VRDVFDGAQAPGTFVIQPEMMPSARIASDT
jgi:hypothetical protein